MRLNGKMNKKQPLVILALAVVGVLSFQNCSKVGVQDLASTNEALVNDLGNTDNQPGSTQQIDPDVLAPSSPVAEIPDEGGAPVTPDAPPDMPSPGENTPPVVTMPPANPPTTPPPTGGIPSNPEPMPAPAPHCKKMNQLGLVVLDSNMQTVRCLRDSNQRCVVVCHKPAQKEKRAHTKLVHSEGALKAHLGHGDTLGACKAITQDDDVCESNEDVHLPPKKYGEKDKGRHYDEGGKTCGKSSDHRHANNPGDDRDDDDDESHEHERHAGNL